MTQETEKNDSLKVAIIQLCSKEDVDANLRQLQELIEQASAQGAEFIALPENCLWLSPDSNAIAPHLFPDSAAFHALRTLARANGIYLLIGSLPEASHEEGKVFNTSVLLGPNGDIEASYRKCFLFDVDLKGRESHLESERVTPGNDLTMGRVNGHLLGMSICYDLRFPELYRHLTEKGASMLSIPAAFTSTTGRDHWEILLRARAIENQCFVIAPDQWGHHGGKRRSYGRSMIISPWGIVLAQLPDGPGYAIAELKFEQLVKLRNELPCLTHKRNELFEK